MKSLKNVTAICFEKCECQVLSHAAVFLSHIRTPTVFLYTKEDNSTSSCLYIYFRFCQHSCDQPIIQCRLYFLSFFRFNSLSILISKVSNKINDDIPFSNNIFNNKRLCSVYSISRFLAHCFYFLT
jgi:hypothetical protein